MKRQTEEEKRLNSASWKKWGPYVAERAWGTVREDYSKDGDAWRYFPYEDAKSRAYRWGEDAIAGLTDRYQTLVFGFGFWNGHDPEIKERLFGLSSPQGNHGEDVKELYYKLEALPSFSYLSYLYKYPMAFPYDLLLDENQKRSSHEPEFELIDTNAFADNTYFDLFISYAKIGPEDIVIELKAINRSAKSAPLHIFPQLTFRNRWSWNRDIGKKPQLQQDERKDVLGILASDEGTLPPKKISMDYVLGSYYLYGPLGGVSLFTENTTKGTETYTKDAFHRYIQGDFHAVSPEKIGTKACLYYQVDLQPQEERTWVFRFTNSPKKKPFQGVEKTLKKRRQESNAYYEKIAPKWASAEEKKLQKSALSSLLWNLQSYIFDVNVWLLGDDPLNPPPLERKEVRNEKWRHLNSMRILSMPDVWEYPWFAAWDLSFHAVALALVDLAFAKEQLWALLFDQFQHPNGQIPAYEWEFSDVNPPVQAWALLKLISIEEKTYGTRDDLFVERCFHKLLLNFVWWVNKVDTTGKNVFEGGFLGLDNITILDRSLKEEAYRLDEADGAGWMAMFCFDLMEIALRLAEKNPAYENLAIKFFEHYVYIAAALRKGYWRSYDMFDAKEGFFYSVMDKKEGNQLPLKVRSLVGIIPFFASRLVGKKYIEQFPTFFASFSWVIRNRKDLSDTCVESVSTVSGEFYFFSLITQKELPRFLSYLVDEKEFLSPYGLRSLSKYHEKHPFSFD